MKSGIENRHLVGMGEELLAGHDAFEVGRIMQRRQIGAGMNDRFDLFVDAGRLMHAFATVDHPVTDGGDRVDFNSTMIRMAQQRFDLPDGLRDSADRDRSGEVVMPGAFKMNHSSGLADTIDHTVGDHC